MRLKSYRYPPISDAEMTAEQSEAVGALSARRGVKNVFRTLANAPNALKGFMPWGSYILSKKNGLAPRERELVIMRVGYLCRSGYEWTQHKAVSLSAGLTEVEIERIKAGPDAPGWSPADRALLKATDELHHDQFIGDATWADLGRAFDDKQRMDVVFTAGQYTQVAMMLNTFGVQLDDGQTLDPDLAAY